jgi:hypothetical protein
MTKQELIDLIKKHNLTDCCEELQYNGKLIAHYINMTPGAKPWSKDEVFMLQFHGNVKFTETIAEADYLIEQYKLDIKNYQIWKKIKRMEKDFE